jgi:hypothetical protein
VPGARSIQEEDRVAAEDDTQILNLDPTQMTDLVQNLARDVAKILTPNEEILYIAAQNATALSIRQDCAVATTNRMILYRRDVLGRVSFTNYQWQDVKLSTIKQGVLSSEFQIETIDGHTDSLGNLDKDQAKRLYSYCQQMDQEWREKRRVRHMEEERARSGGLYMTPPDVHASATKEDPVDKLAKAKAMRDKGLISEVEYDALKAKILSTM